MRAGLWLQVVPGCIVHQNEPVPRGRQQDRLNGLLKLCMLHCAVPCCAMLCQVGAMVQSRHAPPAGSESFRDRDRDSWPPLTDADREALRVRRRERLQDIVTKTCGPLIKSAMQHHVSENCRGQV